MQESLLRYCIKKGFLVDKEALSYFKEIDDENTAKLFLEYIIQLSRERMITKKIFDDNFIIKQALLRLPDENRKHIEKLSIKLGINIEITRKLEKVNEPKIDNNKTFKENKESDIKVMSIPFNPAKKIEVQDFVKHFRKRFQNMKGVLQEHLELTNLLSLNKIPSSKSTQQFSIIVMIKDKKITKNKNLLLEVEDLTGESIALINQNKEELSAKAEDIVLDSIIGLKCTGSKEMIFVNDIIFPESRLPERKYGVYDEYAAFIGDMHVGSNRFMEEEFMKFIDYLNGKISNETIASKIKYLFVIGDIVCGVGIFPGQENELSILDLEQQFQKAAELFSKIRKDIKIIICPGNHDGVRIMEPQPLFDEKYAWPLYQLENVTLVSNPCTINFGAHENFDGFNLLMYHGFSFHYYVDNVGHLRRSKATNKPEKIMTFLLKHRHLAPSHSSTLYFPSQENDALFIEKVPDILFSGHTHKSAVTYANNVLLISGSSWESQSIFQEKMGNEPDFCKVPIFNLKTRTVHIIDFENYNKK
jgi:DNA polymerase II small subunit